MSESDSQLVTLKFGAETTHQFERGAALEWLETNGIGGWASSTANGAHTRRYHGLLVAALNPPHGRKVLLSRLDETVVTAVGRYELSCNRFPGAVYPSGFQYFETFERGLFPSFEYAFPGGRMRKTVAAICGENTTVVLYEILQADAAITLELKPFVADRDYHSLTHANDGICRTPQFVGDIFEVKPYADSATLFLQVAGATFEAAPDWYYRFEYSWERMRGLEFEEDLFLYGTFRRRLSEGERFGVIISTRDPRGRDAEKLLRIEADRRLAILKQAPVQDRFARTLTLAADQFVVTRKDQLKTVIAGYHWFGDWGRDTMIALPGLCFVPGRLDEAKKILRAFAGAVSEGMLPNLFTDDGKGAAYNSVDAALWFFIAVQKYLDYGGEPRFVERELFASLQQIAALYESGTRYRIHLSTDGLIHAGEPGVQLTWMDAKVGDFVVTPRIGAPVEINALWYNVLRILADLTEQFVSKAAAAPIRKKAEAFKERFNEAFWNEAVGGLYDCVDEASKDPSIRPNQIYALSLPFPLLAAARAKRVLALVESRLLTPVGLRSLDPLDPAYRPRYEGGVYSRDTAYHQGTVWSFLLGPFATALVRFGGDDGRARARVLFSQFEYHLGEAGVGSVSEIFDGEAPHSPQGCVAQAWGVAEILRGYVEDVHGISPVTGR